MTRKSEKLYDAVTDVRDDLVEGAAQAAPRRRRRRWPAAVAAVLAVAVLGGVLLRPGGGPLTATAYALALAQYPEMAPYPDETAYVDPATGEFDNEGFLEVYDAWWADRLAQWDQPEGYADGLEDFFAATIPQFLSGGEGENRVYSPLNVYLALAMLSELTDGESRAQILALLGQEDMDALRAQVGALWNANYCDDGASVSLLASSVWLDEDVDFVQSTLDTLAQVYYASSYQGEMGSAELNQALQAWLNEQTGGLLEEQAGQIQLSPDTLLALATTICFRAKWSDEFSDSATQSGVFHAPQGDVECDFMHQSATRTYCWGERFSAVSLPLQQSGSMWLILPDEGVEAESLLEDPQVLQLLSSGEWEDSEYLMVHLSLPKFDVASQLDLRDGLEQLGVTDVFDPERADFSPTTGDMEGIFLSQASHAARVAIDEEGVTAAAYTVMMAMGGGTPDGDEVDFVLDRPFLFAVTSRDGLPLFVGVVNQPQG